MSIQESFKLKTLTPIEKETPYLIGLERFLNGKDGYQDNKISIDLLKEDGGRKKEVRISNLKDPLRLCFIVEEKKDDNQDKSFNKNLDQEKKEAVQNFPFEGEDLPYRFKPKAAEVQNSLLSKLYVAIHLITNHEHPHYYEWVTQLPFATAHMFPPTPPPKEPSTTPTLSPPTILPQESYASVHREPEKWYQDHDQNRAWLYSETRLSDDFSTTPWENIFHPQSTFKSSQGELSYHGLEDQEASVELLSTATLPRLMPTPPPKPSPVLSDVQIVATESRRRDDGRYYHMLHHIQDEFLKSHSILIDTEPEKEEVVIKKSSCGQKRLFWFGFVFPLCWIMGGFFYKRNPHLVWQKRCRLAAVYFSIGVSVVSVVAAVHAGSIAIRQSQTDTIRAVIAD